MKNCKQCNKEFERYERTKIRSPHEGQFCSQRCASHYTIAHKPKLEHKPNVMCAYCNKSFYKSESRQAQSKSGLYFCCRAHKDAAQRIGGISEIMPPHYGTGTGKNTYRDIFFRKSPELRCQICSYNAVPEILQVHHKDCNRSNNSHSNLTLLCPTCHEVEHFRDKTGRWKPKEER